MGIFSLFWTLHNGHTSRNIMLPHKHVIYMVLKTENKIKWCEKVDLELSISFSLKINKQKKNKQKNEGKVEICTKYKWQKNIGYFEQNKALSTLLIFKW